MFLSHIKVSYIGFFYSVFLTFITAPFYYSIVGSEKFGLYVLLISFTNLFLIVDLGFSLRIQRILARKEIIKLPRINRFKWLVHNGIANGIILSIFILFLLLILNQFVEFFLDGISTFLFIFIGGVAFFLRMVMRSCAKGLSIFQRTALALIFGETSRHATCFAFFLFSKLEYYHLFAGVLIGAVVECAILAPVLKNLWPESSSFLDAFKIKRRWHFSYKKTDICSSRVIMGMIQTIGSIHQFIINTLLALFFGLDILGFYHLIKQYFFGLISISTPFNTIIFTYSSNKRRKINNYFGWLILLSLIPWWFLIFVIQLQDLLCRYVALCVPITSDNLDLAWGFAVFSSFSIFYGFLRARLLGMGSESLILRLTVCSMVIQVVSLCFVGEISLFVIAWAFSTIVMSITAIFALESVFRFWYLAIWFFLVLMGGSVRGLLT